MHIHRFSSLTSRLTGSSALAAKTALVLSLALFASIVPAWTARAQTTSDGLSLQVSPSPLVATIKPGQKSSLDLQIRNTGSSAISLKMGLRSFTINEATGKVELAKDEPSEARQFVHFASPTFSVQPGAMFPQKIIVDTPASAGFTYTFAIVISQQQPATQEQGKTAIQGSVAVFSLLSVDKPGATRELQLQDLHASHNVYEYLPAEISMKLKSTGNSLVQPKGTVYIQRHSNDSKPLATIPINANSGFILPGNSRSFTADWKAGLPHYTQDGDSKSQGLNWQGGDLSKIRFGRYVAKIVAVYDDGGRDVPLTAEVTFWVIPWRILLIITALLTLTGVGVFVTFRRSTRLITKRRVKLHEPHHD